MPESSADDDPILGPSNQSQAGNTAIALHTALEQLRREGEEKSLLISELRHRMKNNLQTVQSLLRLQKTRTQNASTRRELAHLEMQIAALNGVDGELVAADARQLVDLSGYLRRLLTKLKEAFGADTGQGLFRIELDAVQVSYRTAVNIGLLVNEAVTNSFKHAVPRGATEIGISLKGTQGSATLYVSDNGPGFQNPLPGHAGGMILMKRLAERGGLSVERDLRGPGARYIVRLPLTAAEAAGLP